MCMCMRTCVRARVYMCVYVCERMVQIRHKIVTLKSSILRYAVCVSFSVRKAEQCSLACLAQSSRWGCSSMEMKCLNMSLPMRVSTRVSYPQTGHAAYASLYTKRTHKHIRA